MENHKIGDLVFSTRPPTGATWEPWNLSLSLSHSLPGVGGEGYLLNFIERFLEVQPPEINSNPTASEGCSGSKKLEKTYPIAEPVSNCTADANYLPPSVHHLHYVKLPAIQEQI